MSHLIFDTKDWKFILNEVIGLENVLALPVFADYDESMFEQIVEEGVKLAVEKIAPANEPGDREECRIEDGRVITPSAYEEPWKAYTEGGWISMELSPEWGGMGLPSTVAAPLAEAFSAACQAFYMYGGLTTGSAHLIESFANEELKKTFVPKMYSGQWGGTMCLTEPQAGSAVGDLTTSAVLNDDGTYSIEGSKIFISGGDATFYENAVHLVLARVKGDPAGTKGISLFAVPRLNVNDDGSVGDWNHVSVTALEHKMGINGSATCQITFGDGEPSVGYLVGEQRMGMPYMFQMMNHARLATGMQGVALGNAGYQQALAYAKERKQGPSVQDLKGASVEIINHPDVRRNLMFMKAFGEGTRGLAGKIAFASDVERHSTDEAAKTAAGDFIEIATPIMKAYSTDKGFKSTELAVQVFGGYGYTKDFPVEQYLRDVKISSIYEGTNGIQALDLLGRKMRQKGGALFMSYVMQLGKFIGENKENEAISDVIATLERAQGSLGEVAFWLSQTGAKDLSLSLLQATPFLELFGDVMIGHVLAERASIAAKALVDKHGTATPSREDRENNTEVNFYASKIDTARFFMAEIVALAPSKARSMTSGQRAALDIVF